jgi:hypothetical protein
MAVESTRDRVVRRGRITGGTWLCGLAAGVWVSRPLAAVLGVIGLLVLLSAWPPVGRRLPTFKLNVQIRWPEAPWRERLRADTAALIEEIHAHLQSQPTTGMQFWAGQSAVASAKEGDKERVRAAEWEAFTEREERARQELELRFAGPVRTVAREYQRRGMLDEQGVAKLGYQTRAPQWIVEAAADLEALAHRL